MAQQQHGAFDDVVLVVLADDTVALLVGELELPKVAHQDRRAVVLGNDDIAEVVEGPHQADAADDITELAAIEHAAAGIGVIVADRIGDIAECDIKAHQLLRIELELILRRQPAEVRNIGNARHLLQGRDHRPLLDLRQFAQVFRVGLQNVIEDLPGRRRQRIEARRQVRRQRRVLNPLQDALTRPVVFNAVAKLQGDQRQAEGRARAHHCHAGRAVKLALERNGDLLLDFFGRQARRGGNHLGFRVRDIRIGLDREPGPRIVAVDADEHADHRHHQALAQRKADDPINHRAALRP